MRDLRSLPLILAAIVAAPAGALAQAGAFDGTWNGRGTLTANRGRGTDCGPPTFNHRLTVQNGQLTMNYSPQAGIRFEGPVAADGSFNLVHGQSRFSGRFSASGMAGTFSHPSCERSWQFRRAG